MKIEFKNSIRRLNFLCHLLDVKVAWMFFKMYETVSTAVSLVLHWLFEILN